MECKFEALIKQLTIKSLVSLDKEARLVLQFNAENPEICNRLNELMRADSLVEIQIKETDDA